MTRIRKRYVDGPFGQVHARLSPPVAGTMPLVCLHATAYSSRTFVPLMQQAADVRQVIAIDLPGYGESDAPAAQVEIAAYADAVAVAIRALADGGPVALLGYHTGVYVGAELAVRHPALVDRLVLIGIPYFQALDLAFWRKKLGHRTVLGDRLAQFDERWNFLVASRAPEVSLERGFENFVVSLTLLADLSGHAVKAPRTILRPSKQHIGQRDAVEEHEPCDSKNGQSCAPNTFKSPKSTAREPSSAEGVEWW